jgi:hypothetical protein
MNKINATVAGKFVEIGGGKGRSSAVLIVNRKQARFSCSDEVARSIAPYLYSIIKAQVLISFDDSVSIESKEILSAELLIDM